MYAVIQGVGSSSDGRSKSVYAPVAEGQAKAIRRSYALAGFGATGVLPDPELQLYNTTPTLVAMNTGWGSNAAAVTAADSAVGAFALAPGSHDTALVESLPSGGYGIARLYAGVHF